MKTCHREARSEHMKIGTGKVKGHNMNLHSQNAAVYFSHLRTPQNETKNKQTKTPASL